MNVESLISGYQNYLDKNQWDVYLTITFRQAGVDSAEAFRRLKRFLKRLNSSKNEFFKKFVKGFAVAERQGRMESVHIHSLLAGISPNRVPLLERCCKEVFGMSKAEVYDYGRRVPASNYLAKKCMLGTAEDWMFFKVNSQWRGEHISKDCK